LDAAGIGQRFPDRPVARLRAADVVLIVTVCCLSIWVLEHPAYPPNSILARERERE